MTNEDGRNGQPRGAIPTLLNRLSVPVPSRLRRPTAADDQLPRRPRCRRGGPGRLPQRSATIASCYPQTVTAADTDWHETRDALPAGPGACCSLGCVARPRRDRGDRRGVESTVQRRTRHLYPGIRAVPLWPTKAFQVCWQRATGLPSGSATVAIRSPHGMSSGARRIGTFASANCLTIPSRSAT